MRNFKRFATYFILISTSSFYLPCHAATEPPALSYAGSVTLVSDYIWRGQSQTWGGPAVQLGLEASHVAGAYAGFWASNNSDQWVPGSTVETDWYAGFRNKLPDALSDFGYDFNVNYAYFPGANFNKTGFNNPAASVDTVEVYAAVSYQWLTLKAGQVLTNFYGWDETNSSPGGGFAGDASAGVTGSTKGSYFVEANVSWEIAEGWNLIGQWGRQTIKNSTGIDWSYYKLGLTRSIDAWVMGIAYWGSSEPKAFKNFLGLKNNGATSNPEQSIVVLSVARNF
jgi:uncharacterized protein (TIGR02001 family)